MSNWVDTEGQMDNDTNKDSELIRWLQDNNLQQVIPTFKNENMTMEELIEFGEEDPAALKEYLIGLNIPSASITRICFKIKKRLKNINKPIDNKPKSVIVITQKEQNGIDTLEKRDKNITSLIHKLSQQKQTILQNEKTVKSKINAAYNNLINLISNHQNTILKQLSEISNKKQLKLSAISQQLEKQQNQTKNGIKNCNELVHNTDINRNDRQNKIISVVNAIVSDKIPPHINIPTDILFEFNTDTISTFLENLSVIHGDDSIPIIEDIKCESIGTQCIVQWKAHLSEQDVNAKIRSQMHMKIINVNEEMDEKEREQMDSDYIEFDKQNTNYKYEMNELKHDTLYKMKICLFEGKENDNIIERYDVKPLLFNFKTLGYDFYEKAFNYQSDYDKNGILYFLGTNYGKEEWENPAVRGLVKLNSSGWSKGSINDMVGRTYKWSYSSPKKGSWVTIDFGGNMKIKPNAYTLQYTNNEGGAYLFLRNWNFEGSNDGSNWEIIKQHTDDTTFNKKNESHTFTINDCNKYYQYFRIKMTGKTSDNHWFFVYTMLEIYGHLTGNK
eukprot:34949_1